MRRWSLIVRIDSTAVAPPLSVPFSVCCGTLFTLNSTRASIRIAPLDCACASRVICPSRRRTGIFAPARAVPGSPSS